MVMLHRVCPEYKYSIEYQSSIVCSQSLSAATKLPKNQLMQMKFELKSGRG